MGPGTMSRRAYQRNEARSMRVPLSIAFDQLDVNIGVQREPEGMTGIVPHGANRRRPGGSLRARPRVPFAVPFRRPLPCVPLGGVHLSR